MSKKNRRRPPAPTPSEPESRGAEVLTVAWMMSVVTTVICGLIGGVILLVLRDRVGAETPRVFGRLLHFSALITAVLSLVLVGPVLKLRKHPPPASITWFAVLVALVVIAAAFLY